MYKVRTNKNRSTASTMKTLWQEPEKPAWKMTHQNSISMHHTWNIHSQISLQYLMNKIL